MSFGNDEIQETVQFIEFRQAEVFGSPTEQIDLDKFEVKNANNVPKTGVTQYNCSQQLTQVTEIKEFQNCLIDSASPQYISICESIGKESKQPSHFGFVQAENIESAQTNPQNKNSSGMTKRKDQVLRDLIRKIKKVFKASFFDTMSSQQSKTESLKELASSLASYVSLKISECD